MAFKGHNAEVSTDELTRNAVKQGVYAAGVVPKLAPIQPLLPSLGQRFKQGDPHTYHLSPLPLPSKTLGPQITEHASTTHQANTLAGICHKQTVGQFAVPTKC